MKNHIFFALSFLFVNTLYSQVLYTENFDNHSVGNLGTDPTGIISGQWGWYTFSLSSTSNTMYTIVNETGRGKVLDITSNLTHSIDLYAFKKELHTTINNRNAGNDVVMFKIDYHTGSKQSSASIGTSHISLLSEGDPLASPLIAENLASITYDKGSGSISGSSTVGQPLFSDNQNNKYYLPFNTWVKIIIYLDYPNRKQYYHFPLLNKVFANDFFKNNTSNNLIQDFAPSNIALSTGFSISPNDPQTYTRNRYDNIQITALNAVPPAVISLSTNEQLSSKFNIFPNPANSFVNITNSENMAVQEVTIYDISGKQLSKQNFDSSQEIQLNVESLSSGTYMLHIKSDSGTAVKKLIKK